MIVVREMAATIEEDGLPHEINLCETAFVPSIRLLEVRRVLSRAQFAAT